MTLQSQTLRLTSVLPRSNNKRISSLDFHSSAGLSSATLDIRGMDRCPKSRIFTLKGIDKGIDYE